jgi:hypothetical protein
MSWKNLLLLMFDNSKKRTSFSNYAIFELFGATNQYKKMMNTNSSIFRIFVSLYLYGLQASV